MSTERPKPSSAKRKFQVGRLVRALFLGFAIAFFAMAVAELVGGSESTVGGIGFFLIPGATWWAYHSWDSIGPPQVATFPVWFIVAVALLVAGFVIFPVPNESAVATASDGERVAAPTPTPGVVEPSPTTPPVPLPTALSLPAPTAMPPQSAATAVSPPAPTVGNDLGPPPPGSVTNDTLRGLLSSESTDLAGWVATLWEADPTLAETALEELGDAGCEIIDDTDGVYELWVASVYLGATESSWALDEYGLSDPGDITVLFAAATGAVCSSEFLQMLDG